MVLSYRMDQCLLPSALRQAVLCPAEALTEVAVAKEAVVLVSTALEAVADPTVSQPTPGQVAKQQIVAGRPAAEVHRCPAPCRVVACRLTIRVT